MSEVPAKAPKPKNRREAATGTSVHPDRRKAVVAMLSDPETTKKDIQTALKMDPRTIDAIIASDLPDVAEAKHLIARLAYQSTVGNLKSAIQQADEGKGSALAAKLSWEVYTGAVGEASQIVDVRHSFPQLAEFETPPDRLADRQGEPIDV